MLTGITLIKDGNKLNYPWKEQIHNMTDMCDRVLVNCGFCEDGTMEDLVALAKDNPSIWPVYREWDMSNTGDGRELAAQANFLLQLVNDNEWVLYLQADEFLLESCAEALKGTLKHLSEDTTAVELFRTYFWSSKQVRSTQEEIWLSRIFRAGTHQVGGDGMHLDRKSGRVARIPMNIYHYSRMGTEEEITKRIRTLDGLFHEPETVAEFADFTYEAIPQELMDYDGPHPQAVKELWNEERTDHRS